MKQYITVGQLKELSQEQIEKIREWWKPQWGDQVKIDFQKKITEKPSTIINLNDHTYDGIVVNPEEIKDELPLFSIGQMIEFLGENIINIFFSIQCINYQINGQIKSSDFKEREICDALWEAVKEVLNK